MHMRSQWLVFINLQEMANEVGDLSGSLTQLDNVATLSILGTHVIRLSATEQAHKAIVSATEGSLSSNTTMDKNELKDFMIKGFLRECASVSRLWVHTLFYAEERKRFLNMVAMVTNGSARRKVNTDAVFPNTLFGLNNRTFIVSGVEWPHFFCKIQEGNTTTYDGVVIQLFNRLQVVLNFTVVYTEPDNKSVDPHPDCNGNYPGVLGQLQRKVHMMLFVAIVVYGALTTLMERANPYYQSRKIHSSLHSGIDSIQYMFGAVLNQGGSSLPNSCTGRVLVSFWWLFSIIIASTYGGNLIAFLTVTKENLPFSDLEGLLGQDRYRWGFVSGTMTKDQILANNLYEAIYSRAVAWNRTTPGLVSANLAGHLERVRSEEYAFLGPASTSKAWVQKDCNLAYFLLEDAELPTYIGITKDSPYRDLISDVLVATKEAGIVEHWLSEKLSQTSEFCEGSLIAEAQAISLLDVQSVFYASVIGIVTSCLLLAAETLLKKFCARRPAQTSNSGAHKTKKSSVRVGSGKGPSTRNDDSLLSWLFSTLKSCRRRNSASKRPSAVSSHSAPSWPKADTRSVWDFNTSFRRPGEELRTNGTEGETRFTVDDHSNACDNSSSTRKEISIIALSRRDLRSSKLGRNDFFTDFRRLSCQNSGHVRNKQSLRKSNSLVEQQVAHTDGCFNPCFCDSDSDTSGDGAEDRRSDDGRMSCDSGVDRCSISSTRFGDNESDLW
ncbi:glutamate receptor ionotropic, kainate 2 [Plakobranchus ocellatus]|uniref:Glutamate receptor ionotropic, kainate 2 n=1 Tax=Plakobranchus ocellatus TaxID=259542 RepID=A0AAV4BAF8_9GAST|nr:glutamate receptor ionotropic, kainate 2 [Plakobranchus ocellatus]